MEWVVNFGGSSRSGRIVTSRHIRDGWLRVAPFVFSPGSYEMVMAMLWCEVKMSADRPVRDGWQRPVTTLTDGVDPFPFVCSWGVVEWDGNVGGSSRSGRIATTSHQRERWGRFVSVCLFARDFENGHGGVMEWGDNIGGSSRSGRIVTTRHIRDGWWHFVTVCQFGRDLGNIHGGVMECGGNFGGSSRWERITTTRHECDGWCRLVSVCLFARAFKSYLVVWWSGEQFSADRPDRDGSQRPVISVTDGDVSWQSVSSGET